MTDQTAAILLNHLDTAEERIMKKLRMTIRTAVAHRSDAIAEAINASDMGTDEGDMAACRAREDAASISGRIAGFEVATQMIEDMLRDLRTEIEELARYQ